MDAAVWASVTYAQFQAATFTQVLRVEVAGNSSIFRAVGIGAGFIYVLEDTTKPGTFDTDFPAAVQVQKLFV
jgi:hypothetical protein